MTLFWMPPSGTAMDIERLWPREQQKKIALGHKPDDHDQGQQMM